MVEVFGIRRVAEHGENPAQAAAAIKHGGEHFARIAQHMADARFAGDGINQADGIVVAGKRPGFERGELGGGGKQSAPGFRRDRRGRGKFGRHGDQILFGALPALTARSMTTNSSALIIKFKLPAFSRLNRLTKRCPTR
ncbi:MAG: hypothetical protein KA236_14305 [Verrucomicrobia bacterium]|nr:hypothetical protein [Verrucomicrobiota bacterium]